MNAPGFAESRSSSCCSPARKYNPDVVGINEAHRNTWQARFGDHVRQLERLTGMRAVFGRSYIFAGGEFGNAVLTRGQIVSHDVHDLPGTGEPRTLLETIVNVNGGAIEFCVAHTTAWGLAQQSDARRAAAVRQRAPAASRHPFIFTRDLNAAPESEEIARFLNRNILQFARSATDLRSS